MVVLISAVRFGISVNVSVARASHFASLGGCLCPPLSPTSLCVIPGLTGHLCCYASNTDTFIFMLIVILHC